MSNAVLQKKSIARTPQRKGPPRVPVSLRLRHDVYSNLATCVASSRLAILSCKNGNESPLYMQDIVDAAIEMYLRKRNAWPAPSV